MKTIDKIITKVNTKAGVPHGRPSVGERPNDVTVYDCKVPMNGVYDTGGAYWGAGKELRVSYTKDMSYVHFYRKE